ncbi:tetratricopeptide repeat protein [Aquimarina sp. AU474]|uniref:tetratricopeptide repeat protein n=1 Tax=Aquimarina sp. AU474 TaxID=2108529 RepID=UPI001358E096|nr:tetratricopeptide repeat protein [Aquimarina sp. AU474]
MIIFLPVLGSLIYVVTQVFNKTNLDVVQDEIVQMINPSKKINDLQKQLDFADTFQNHVNLADAFFEAGDYNNAIATYEKAIKDDYSKDDGVVKKLIVSYSKTGDHDKTVFCAEKIVGKPGFKGSKSQFLYGLALEELERSEEAEENLKAIDQRYSNYRERYILAQYFIDKGKSKDGKEILLEIISESQHMSKPNRIKYKDVVNDVKKLESSL